MLSAVKLISLAEPQKNSNKTPNPSLQPIAIDGDTLQTQDGETIRLLCVNTPEKGEKGYDDAANFLSSQLSAGEIRIERNGTDKYNRTLAWVYSSDADGNEILLNKMIIDLGYGELFEYEGTECGKVE